MKCITNIAISNDRKNKTRSILIVLTILLSTMLLTIVGTFCYDSIRYNHENAGKQFGSYYGTYINVDDSQIHEMKLRSEFTNIGLMAQAGKVKSDREVSLYWADDTVRDLANLNETLEEGNFPQNKYEVVAQRTAFIELGCENPKVGDEIVLSCRSDNNSEFITQTFVISGLLKENTSGISQKSYNMYVSKDYYENQISKEQRFYTVFFRLNESVHITSDNAEEIMIDLAEKCQISEKQVVYNGYYLRWALDPGIETIVGGSLIGVFIIFFSVIVIYNIFQIGIKQKIQEYGKIKAIGATKSQLRGIVLREGMLLGIIGIPIGLIVGCIVAKFSLSWILKQSGSIQPGLEKMDVSSVSIPLLCGILLISFLTMWIALLKPMKIVIKISPVEAIRFQNEESTKTHLRKGYQTIGVKELIFVSFLANKKRTVTTVFALGLSCVLFLVIANFVGNIDNEYDARGQVEYGQFAISLNYSLDDKVYLENNLDSILKKDYLNQSVVNQLKEIKGVTEVKTRNLLAIKLGNELNSVLVLDKEGFEHFADGDTGKGKLNYEETANMDAIIYGWSYFIEYYGYELGQKINGTIYGGKEDAAYEGIMQGAFGNCDADWAITEDTYNKLGLKNTAVGYVWLDCDKDNIATVKAELDKIFGDNKHIEIESYQDVLRTSQVSTRLLKVACYTILAVIGLIGFINIVNTMVISTITRKHEFGVLQAIGMTNRQLNFILQMEGMVYMLGTVFVASIIGIPAGYGLFGYGKRNGFIGLHEYHFPWMELLIMVIVLIVMQFILSYILSRNIRRETLTERIRYHE